ncbi:hypothetical protein [Luteolibacter marinus]|uniref:hypothetical protein n=1 Tax=Luteolibacter marinus TaxID=2776705 RepID=UPI00186792A9|nr:hypothetical protein [Luteolibacter marinus]
MAVPPDKRTETWKLVGTGELSLPRGATSINRLGFLSVPQAPPGTVGPVGRSKEWKKLVITGPIAVSPCGFPKFFEFFLEKTID